MNKAADDLTWMAYNGQDAAVYAQVLARGGPVPAGADDRHVLLSLVLGAAVRVRRLRQHEREAELDEVCRIVSDAVDHFGGLCAHQGSYPIEWFRALAAWTDWLIEDFRFDTAKSLLELAIRTGVARHPPLDQRVRAALAQVLAATGRVEDAAASAEFFARRPYLTPDRELPALAHRRLASVLALTGRVQLSRTILWRGLLGFHTDDQTRESLADWLRQAYRTTGRALATRDATLSQRIVLLSILLQRALARHGGLRRLGLYAVVRLLNRRILYAINYRRPWKRVFAIGAATSSEGSRTDRILVTRAMGGIGDLLMMTPGLAALKMRQPHREIHFAIPQRYFPLFEGCTDFTCFDITSAQLDLATYSEWYDLTDCPAARAESQTAPNVRKSRIEIFAQALGAARLGREHNATKPRYHLKAGEVEEARQFLRQFPRPDRRVVGVQVSAEEPYRSYPHVDELVGQLSVDYNVVLFSGGPIEGFIADDILKVEGRPLREAVALASCCDVLIVPDSSFLHFAGALGVPAVAIFGPTDGRVRAAHYPDVRVISPDAETFPCAPCWRNEAIPCYASGLRESVCLRTLSAQRVTAVTRALLTSKDVKRGQ